MTSRESLLHELAGRLDEAATSATPIAQLSAEVTLTLPEAYTVQALSVARRVARGEPRIGMKMGFTSRAKMAQMGVHDMIWGRLTRAMSVEECGVVKHGRYIHPRVEPEVAFLLKKRLVGRVTALEALSAVEAVAPAPRADRFALPGFQVLGRRCHRRQQLGLEFRDRSVAWAGDRRQQPRNRHVLEWRAEADRIDRGHPGLAVALARGRGCSGGRGRRVARAGLDRDGRWRPRRRGTLCGDTRAAGDRTPRPDVLRNRLTNMSQLFTPLRLRGLTFKHRLFMSPMCQYSSEGGLPTDWHLVHLGSRAVGGVALVMVEATAVTPEGRISPGDSGLWSAAHARAFRPITTFLHAHGAIAGLQLAHAGRKASTQVPWLGGQYLPLEAGGWQTLAPSALAFGRYGVPREMTLKDIDEVVASFEAAAHHALAAGFDLVELHFAHGYLMNEFLSPLSNHRRDDYGGSFENRVRLPLRIVRAVRAIWPEDRPLFVRVSASDWAEGGWDLPQTVALARELKALGVDLIDCSSGGLVHDAKIPLGPGYQVPFAAAVRKETGLATGAVGLITEPAQAEEIVARGEADAVFLGRQLLREPTFAWRAAAELGADIAWPQQYLRAKT